MSSLPNGTGGGGDGSDVPRPSTATKRDVAHAAGAERAAAELKRRVPPSAVSPPRGDELAPFGNSTSAASLPASASAPGASVPLAVLGCSGSSPTPAFLQQLGATLAHRRSLTFCWSDDSASTSSWKAGGLLATELPIADDASPCVLAAPLSHGVAEIQGAKPTMEDRAMIIPVVRNVEEISNPITCVWHLGLPILPSTTAPLGTSPSLPRVAAPPAPLAPPLPDAQGSLSAFDPTASLMALLPTPALDQQPDGGSTASLQSFQAFVGPGGVGNGSFGAVLPLPSPATQAHAQSQLSAPPVPTSSSTSSLSLSSASASVRVPTPPVPPLSPRIGTTPAFRCPSPPPPAPNALAEAGSVATGFAFATPSSVPFEPVPPSFAYAAATSSFSSSSSPALLSPSSDSPPRSPGQRLTTATATATATTTTATATATAMTGAAAESTIARGATTATAMTAAAAETAVARIATTATPPPSPRPTIAAPTIATTPTPTPTLAPTPTPTQSARPDATASFMDVDVATPSSSALSARPASSLAAAPVSLSFTFSSGSLSALHPPASSPTAAPSLSAPSLLMQQHQHQQQLVQQQLAAFHQQYPAHGPSLASPSAASSQQPSYVLSSLPSSASAAAAAAAATTASSPSVASRFVSAPALPHSRSSSFGSRSSAAAAVAAAAVAKVPHSHLPEGIFGVFDGHGGHEAAEYVRAHLVSNILSHAASAQVDLETSIREGFARTDAELLTFLREAGACQSGTTATVVLVFLNRLTVMNVGDSQALLAYTRPESPSKLGYTFLSSLHIPLNPVESMRVLREHGTIVGDRLAHPQWNPELVNISLTRSLGDAYFKEPQFVGDKTSGLTNEPHISTHQFTKEDQFLLIATDGFWDNVVVEEVVAHVHRHLSDDLHIVCANLIRMAKRRNQNIENATVLIIRFKDTLSAVSKAQR